MKNLILISTFLSALSFRAYALDTLSYSGRLVNTNGSPVSGPVNLRFDLSSTDDPSTTLCTKSITGVPLSNGVFHVKLKFDPPDCSGSSLQNLMESVPAGHNMTYQVTDTTNSRTYAIQNMYAVPSSYMSNYAKNLPQMGAANDQVLKWNNTLKRWLPGDAGTGSGSVTQINTDSSLTGGPITETGTLAVAPGGITNAHLAGAIDPAKLAGTRDGTNYLKGDNTWGDFGNDVLNTILNGFSVASSSVVTATDSILTAIEKLQGQTTDLKNSKLDKTGGTLSVGTINGVPTPLLPDHIVNKQYVDDQLSSATGAINESQWLNATPNIYFNTGNVGIGTGTPDEKLDVVGNIALTGRLRLQDSGSNFVELRAPLTTTGVTFTLPATPGTNGQVLKTDGTGILSWGNSSVGSSDITDGSIVDADVSATANIAQSKIANLTTDLAGKEPTITGGTTAQYWRGDKTWQTLNTDAVPEGATNKYYSNTLARGAISASSPISYNSGTGVIGMVPGTTGDLLQYNGSAWVPWSPNFLTAEVDTLATVTGRGSTTSTPVVLSGGANFPGTGIWNTSGNVGIGTNTPRSKLDVIGGVQIGADAVACVATKAGTIRYNGGNVEYCNGANWLAFGVSGSGITNFNGSSVGTHSLATPGTTGLAPNWVTVPATGVHTLNIPMANAAGVTAGLISKADYDDFKNVANGFNVGSLVGNRIMISTASSIVEAPALTNGQLLIGSTGNAPVPATLTAGTGVTITNSPGGITINATGSGGTVTSVSGTAPISVATGTTTAVISIAQANTTTDGYLSSTDWNTFNSKQSPLSVGPSINGVNYPASGAQNLQVTNAPVNLTDVVNLQALNTAIGGLPASVWNTSGSNIYNNNAGNVGIGISNPGEKLDVNGVIRSNYKMEVSRDGNSGMILVNSYRDATNHSKIQLRGARGTQASGAHLLINDIMGEFRADAWTNGSTWSESGMIQVRADEAHSAASSAGRMEFFVTPSASLVFPATPNMVIKSSGNIGIGTATPGAKLEVAGQVKITGGTPGAGKVLTSDATGLATWQSPGAGADNLGNHTAIQNIILGSNWLSGDGGNEGIFINAAGNVGIGTSTPSDTLEINKNVAGLTSLSVNNPNSGSGSSAAWTVSSDSSSTYLEQKSSSAGAAGISNPNGGQLVSTGAGGLSIAAIHSSGELRFFTGGSANTQKRMTILSSGNIGIGTSTPSTTLEVAGQVKITGGSPGAGKVLTSDAAGLASWTTIAAGGGTVTNVTGTAPISVATGTTTPVVSISQANTTTNGYLSSTDWNTFNSKLGTSTSFSGDVTGTYNATSVDRIKGTPVTITSLTSGNLLRFNGTAWVNAMLGASDIPNLDAAKITTGVLPVARGGTNNGTLSGNRIMVSTATSIVEAPAMTNGQLLIGSTGATPVPATLTAGTGVTITNSAGGITIAASGSGGTVTNVTGTAPISVATGTSTPVISMSQANTTTNGYLSSTDWNTFNNKQSPLSAGPTINGVTYPASGAQNLQVSNAPVNLTDVVNLQALNTAISGIPASVWSTSGSNIYNNNSGNIGVGTSTPSEKLHVLKNNGAFSLEDATYGAGNQLLLKADKDYGPLMMAWTNSAGTSTMNGGSARVRLGGEFEVATSPVTSPGSPRTFTSRLKMDLNGNVGIGLGAGAPTALLEVGGQVKITGGSPGAGKVLTSDASGLATWSTPAGSGDFMKDGSVVMTGAFKAADGSAASPSITFGNALATGFYNLSGNMMFTHSGTTRFGMDNSSVYGASGAIWRLTYTNTAAAPAITLSGMDTGFFRPAASAVGISTAGNERMRVDATGNVGIGTTSPGAMLEVAGQVKITGGTPGAGKVLTSDASGLATWQTAGGSDNLGNHTATQNIILGSNWINGDSDSEGLSVNSWGQVKASGSVMQPMFTVESNGGGTDYIFKMDNNSNDRGYIVFENLLSSGALEYFGVKANDFILGTDGLERLVVKSDGKVGIGISSPNSTLQVNGSIASVAVNDTTPTSFNMAAGNYQYTATGCSGATWTLTNMVEGTSYTIAVQNNTHSGSCVFSDGSSTFKYRPANATPASGHVIYSFVKYGSFVYISWIDGF